MPTLRGGGTPRGGWPSYIYEYVEHLAAAQANLRQKLILASSIVASLNAGKLIIEDEMNGEARMTTYHL